MIILFFLTVTVEEFCQSTFQLVCKFLYFLFLCLIICHRLRIETRDKKRTDYKQRNYATRNLIDTSSEDFTESPGLQHWADIENLKIAASAYAEAQSITALEQQIAEKKSLSNAARTELVTLEHEMKPYAEMLKYAEQ